MNSEILQKLARYCAYQERCISEIKQKIQELDSVADHAIYIQWLKENNYLNESRFIGLFIRSKFNQKKWGRGKIQFELRKKGISDSEIQAHWDEIAEKDYTEALKILLTKKAESLKKGTSAEKPSFNGITNPLSSIYEEVPAESNTRAIGFLVLIYILQIIMKKIHIEILDVILWW